MNLSKLIQRGDIGQIKQLLDSGARPDQENAVLLAVSRSKYEILKLLVEFGANVNGNDSHGESAGATVATTPLVVAIDSGDYEMSKLLIDSGAEIDMEVEGGYPIHYAASLDDTKILNYLLSKGASMEVINKERNTCLHIACHRGSLEAVRMILSYFVANYDESSVVHYVNKRNVYGLTALHLAVQCRRKSTLKLVKLLLDWRANILIQDKDGDTAIHYLAAYGDIKIARLLLTHAKERLPPDIPNILSISNSSGWTPLFCSATANRAAFLDLFLENGSDMLARDSKDQTVLDWCLKDKYEECINVLMKHFKRNMNEEEFYMFSASISKIISGWKSER